MQTNTAIPGNLIIFKVVPSESGAPDVTEIVPGQVREQALHKQLTPLPAIMLPDNLFLEQHTIHQLSSVIQQEKITVLSENDLSEYVTPQLPNTLSALAQMELSPILSSKDVTLMHVPAENVLPKNYMKREAILYRDKLEVPENNYLASDTLAQPQSTEKSSSDERSWKGINNTNLNNKPQNHVIVKLDSGRNEKDMCGPGNQFDTSNFVPILDRVAVSRALAVLPQILQTRRGSVVPRRTLQPRVRFGPVQGISKSASPEEIRSLLKKSLLDRKPLFLLANEENTDTYIDVTDQDKSNWFSLLPLGDSKSANVWLYQEKNDLYGVTMKTVPCRTPLAIGYSMAYATRHGIPDDQPILDLRQEMALFPQRLNCDVCHRPLPTVAALQRHKKQHHMDAFSPVRRYRCRYCVHTFARLFCLKRHLTLHCTKHKRIQENKEPDLTLTNNEDSTQNIGLSPIQDGSLSATQSGEDSKLPSDESLQNYTNILDISTNLFDTDRMPNLDISGSLRSENDFNSYGVKEDARLTGDFGFDNDFINDLATSSPIKSVKEKQNQVKNSSSPISCPYCKQSILRSKLAQHIRACGARRFQCECGKVFKTKQKLAVHAYTEHNPTEANTRGSKSDKVTTKGAAKEMDNPYKCQLCDLIFKRRGMLVNHMSRLHPASASSVPLMVRERRYSCPVCPKIYRTANKRNNHVTAHHPGMPFDRRQYITGGQQQRSPAVCWACPRQYATRAKLLQHARDKHKQSAPPPNLKSTKSAISPIKKAKNDGERVFCLKTSNTWT